MKASVLLRFPNLLSFSKRRPRTFISGWGMRWSKVILNGLAPDISCSISINLPFLACFRHFTTEVLPVACHLLHVDSITHGLLTRMARNTNFGQFPKMCWTLAAMEPLPAGIHALHCPLCTFSRTSSVPFNKDHSRYRQTQCHNSDLGTLRINSPKRLHFQQQPVVLDFPVIE